MPPTWNFCRAPPAIVTTEEVGSPGLHISESYFARIVPTMFLFWLTHSRLSHAETALLSSEPDTDAWPDVPFTTAVITRPPRPRLILGKPVTVPMPPVYGESRLVSSLAVSCRFQSVQGLAAVYSPGSHSAFR